MISLDECLNGVHTMRRVHVLGIILTLFTTQAIAAPKELPLTPAEKSLGELNKWASPIGQCRNTDKTGEARVAADTIATANKFCGWMDERIGSNTSDCRDRIRIADEKSKGLIKKLEEAGVGKYSPTPINVEDVCKTFLPAGVTATATPQKPGFLGNLKAKVSSFVKRR